MLDEDLGSDRPRQDVIQNSEDFNSHLNSKTRENSETTLENVRLVNSEVSRKIDELKRDLNSKILETINSAINEKKFLSFQTTLGSQ